MTFTQWLSLNTDKDKLRFYWFWFLLWTILAITIQIIAAIYDTWRPLGNTIGLIAFFPVRTYIAKYVFQKPNYLRTPYKDRTDRPIYESDILESVDLRGKGAAPDIVNLKVKFLKGRFMCQIINGASKGVRLELSSINTADFSIIKR